MRPPLNEDWAAILALADASAPTKVEDNRTWLVNRQWFPGRKHHVVAIDTAGQLRAFGAAEETGNGWYRVFLVAAPDDLPSAGDETFQWIERTLSVQPVSGLWAREEPADAELIAFLSDRGFTASGPEAMPGGPTVIVLRKPSG